MLHLARALGVPLVEGGDLVARDGEVSIKTLAGLRPVHMPLRRLDSAFVDPLELRADSALGVTGLVETTRSGTICARQRVGSGVVGTPAMMPFLERLSERLLGQPLQLPSLDVWWLGEPAALAFATGQPRPDDRAALPRPGPRADRRRHAGTAERKALRGTHLAQPGQFVAQYPVTPSLSPRSDGTAWRRPPWCCACFVSAEGDSYRVLPGGAGARAGGRHLRCARSAG